MTKIDKTQYIGITETSDPCFHLDLFDNLYDANIIITKNLSNRLIDKLIEASQNGVKIDLIVRGICCIRPKVKGFTENINVISIVGRYLEHSRVYIFGNGTNQKIYISSADFMTRNTTRRVEVATPIYDKDIQKRIKDMFEIMLKDDENAKEQDADGNYHSRKINEILIDSQKYFLLNLWGRG